jgi:hypothetical protein
MYYKECKWGDLEVRISKGIELRFRGTELAYSLSDLQHTGKGGEYTCWLCNGRRLCAIHGSLYCTVFEQMVLDAQLVIAQLGMLMQ